MSCDCGWAHRRSCPAAATGCTCCVCKLRRSVHSSSDDIDFPAAFDAAVRHAASFETDPRAAAAASILILAACEEEDLSLIHI